MLQHTVFILCKVFTSHFFSLDVLCEIFLVQMRDVEYPIHQFFTVEV